MTIGGSGVGQHGAVDTPFDRTLAALADVDGWMTDAQARRLWDAAGRVPAAGRILEIGSFRGRSTIVLAAAAADGVEVMAVDPHAGNDRGPQEISGFEAEAAEDHEVFHRNLDAAGVSSRVTHLRERSEEAHALVDGVVDLLYIDGAHRFGPARNDIASWGGRVRDGGTMLIHDSFSSVGVSLAIITSLFWGRRFRYLGRSGSLTEYVAERQPMTAGDRIFNATRQAASLPWFARNVIIKVLIVARLGAIARLLGHRQQTWPY